MDSSTIGIAAAEKPDWKESAAFTGEILLRREKDRIVFEFPQKFSRYYGIGKRNLAVSVKGNAVLLASSGSIIEQKKYPA